MMKPSAIAGHILVPLSLGGLLYYLFSPTVIFVEKIDIITGLSIHPVIDSQYQQAFRLIRNYLPDMLWAYALVFALFFILGNTAAAAGSAFLSAFFFMTVMEFLQATSVVPGTFDPYDLVLELLSQILAVVIIKFF